MVNRVKTFEELSREQYERGENHLAIPWKGQVVYGIYEPLPHCSVVDVTIRFLGWKAGRRPGIGGRIESGIVAFDSGENVRDRFVFFADTAPGETVLRITKNRSKKPLSLRLWGVWIDVLNGHDVRQAWSGNTGFLLRRLDESTDLLEFNLGRGSEEPTFDDLIVEVSTSIVVK